jgi:chromosomal replication initiation ATPase DnaA
MAEINLADALLAAHNLCPNCRVRMVRLLAELGQKEKVKLPVSLSPLRQILEEVATETGWPSHQIASGDQMAHLVAARKTFALRARAKGYSLTAIGNTIHRHHTTIVHYLKGAEHGTIEN